MSEVIQFRRRRTSRKVTRLETVAQIIEALERLGGSAHRDLVVDEIVRQRGILAADEVERVRRQVCAVFVDHCETAPRPIDDPVFRQVYGPDSRRWAINGNAVARRRAGDANACSLAG